MQKHQRTYAETLRTHMERQEHQGVHQLPKERLASLPFREERLVSLPKCQLASIHALSLVASIHTSIHALSPALLGMYYCGNVHCFREQTRVLLEFLPLERRLAVKKQ